MPRHHHSTAGRLGGLRSAARYGRAALTAPARAAFLSRFEREVDPDGTLSPVERAQRAAAARRAHMTRLSLLAAAQRRRRSA